jgi:hypothetical protein
VPRAHRLGVLAERPAAAAALADVDRRLAVAAGAMRQDRRAGEAMRGSPAGVLGGRRRSRRGAFRNSAGEKRLQAGGYQWVSSPHTDLRRSQTAQATRLIWTCLPPHRPVVAFWHNTTRLGEAILIRITDDGHGTNESLLADAIAHCEVNVRTRVLKRNISIERETKDSCLIDDDIGVPRSQEVGQVCRR